VNQEGVDYYNRLIDYMLQQGKFLHMAVSIYVCFQETFKFLIKVFIPPIKKSGITPYANLYHYDLPLALHEQYLGWLSPKIVYEFQTRHRESKFKLI